MKHDARHRLADIFGWLRTAKENLPAINQGHLRRPVSSDQIARMSSFVDRLHHAAATLEHQLGARGRRAA